MTTVELLQAARDRLVRDGWTRRTLADPQGRRCAIGAVMDTKILRQEDGVIQFDRDIHGVVAEERQAISFLASVIPEYFVPYKNFLKAQSNVLAVTGFNDAQLSINDVLEMFDEAILKAKESEA